MVVVGDVPDDDLDRGAEPPQSCAHLVQGALLVSVDNQVPAVDGQAGGDGPAEPP